jgi:hypothetical protein
VLALLSEHSNYPDGEELRVEKDHSGVNGSAPALQIYAPVGRGYIQNDWN